MNLLMRAAGFDHLGAFLRRVRATGCMDDRAIDGTALRASMRPMQLLARLADR